MLIDDIINHIDGHSTWGLDESVLNRAKEALVGLPDKPTVVVVVEGGIAHTYTFPSTDNFPVNVIVVDVDMDSEDTIIVSREA